MALETTVFTFKISVPFTDWAKGFDSAEVVAMHEANSIKPLYRGVSKDCLLYTSPSPRDRQKSRMPSSA